MKEIKLNCQKCSAPKTGQKKRGKKRTDGLENSKTAGNMVYFNPNMSILTLNVNGLNTPIIRKIFPD